MIALASGVVILPAGSLSVKYPFHTYPAQPCCIRALLLFFSWVGRL